MEAVHSEGGSILSHSGSVKSPEEVDKQWLQSNVGQQRLMNIGQEMNLSLDDLASKLWLMLQTRLDPCCHCCPFYRKNLDPVPHDTFKMADITLNQSRMQPDNRKQGRGRMGVRSSLC